MVVQVHTSLGLLEGVSDNGLSRMGFITLSCYLKNERESVSNRMCLQNLEWQKMSKISVKNIILHHHKKSDLTKHTLLQCQKCY
jgi:hypothetical protein